MKRERNGKEKREEEREMERKNGRRTLAVGENFFHACPHKRDEMEREERSKNGDDSRKGGWRQIRWQVVMEEIFFLPSHVRERGRERENVFLSLHYFSNK